MRTPSQVDRLFAERAAAVKAGVPASLTPQHAAAEAAQEADGTDAAEQRRRRVQHEADPYPVDVPEVAEVDLADLGKRFTQAVDTPGGYPPMRPVSAEDFRRRPATAGHAAYSPGYEQPGRPVPVPPGALAPGMISRPLLTDGRARPNMPEAC